MHNILAIFRKQIKDTLKNKTVLIQFIMFPILTLIMNNMVNIDGMPENFFVNLFATMYIGMAPLTSMAAVIAEEKEQNTLRVLLMSNVKPYEYLLGIGSYVWIMCMIGASIICAAGGYILKTSICFMIIMAIGIIVSLLIGAVIGTWSRTQMMATSITVPVMLILSFVPMISLFNETIAKVSKYIYSERISIMLNQINDKPFKAGSIYIMLANIFIAVVLFTFAYRKSKI